MKKQLASLAAGLGFAILWSSAATATKLGLQTLQPFVICVFRFFIAGLAMLVIAHLILRYRLPKGKEWNQIALYGLLSNTVYLGLYVLAMRQVSAGLASLAIATNPLFINLLTSFFLRRPLQRSTLLSLVVCMCGVALAAWPLLRNSSSTPMGMVILLSSMLVYSLGVFYFSRVTWNDLPIIVINGWQVLAGAVFILPIVFLTYRPGENTLNQTGLLSVLWLAFPVSLVAVQLWLLILKEDAARSSFWLFLCPIFGFILSNIFTHEHLSLYTVGGITLVIGGLAWQRMKTMQ